MDAKIKKITNVLLDHIERASENEIPRIMKDFVAYLDQEKLLGAWREIEQMIHALWKEKYGVSKITILSAHPLTETAEKEIQKLANGADIERRVDERLIGGAIIRIDDKRIDSSMAGSLQRLKMTLSK